MELKNLKALNQVSTLHLVEYFFVKEMEKVISKKIINHY